MCSAQWARTTTRKVFSAARWCTPLSLASSPPPERGRTASYVAIHDLQYVDMTPVQHGSFGHGQRLPHCAARQEMKSPPPRRHDGPVDADLPDPQDTTTLTLEAFADTIIPGEKRSPDDVAVAGAAEGGGAV